ncbi:MAG TPA: LamG domain-containing protein [Thermoanaerobaculia bacterium]|nr:LamG domain-containing protein [Thermoanaerobaculia bacterium]
MPHHGSLAGSARRSGSFHPLLLALALTLLGAASAAAQPFDAWLRFTGDPTNGWVAVPDSASLDISGNFTIEAWVSITNNVAGEDCRSIAGKGFTQTWWIGQCNVGGQPTLRSYLKGGGSSRNGGIIPRNVLTHIAVVFNGTQRLHYINGELAASFAESGPLPTNASELRIGNDVSWNHTPSGLIDEVRLWNVARTTDQIRANLNKRIVAQAGLVAYWTLDGNFQDVVSTHDGSGQGSGLGFFTWAVGPHCTASTVSQLCLQSRFNITSKWRTNPTPGTPTDGNASVVVAGSNSGIFWFFSSDNWEVMIKAINGCGLNNRYWIFSAATTNVFYRVEVFDTADSEQKIYFNYPGPPAPAVTDTNAFATCP